MKLTGGEIIAEMLIRLEIEAISGIPGHTVLDLIDALYDRQDKIRCILPRNEETSSFLADAYYRVARKPMAVFAHTTVGSTNLLTGVTNAYLDSSAMIVITGQAWTRFQGRGAYQELDRQRDAGTFDIYRGSVKRSWQVNKAEKLPEVLVRAYKLATSSRPGPVHIDVTQEAMVERVEVDLPETVDGFVPLSGIRAPRAGVARAAGLLRTAQRPAILAGGGVVGDDGACQALVALAELLHAPVATTIMGKGAIPEDHPLALGVCGWVGTLPANRALRESDVLLAVGTRLNETDTSGWEPGRVFNIPPTKLIQVNIEPADISNYYPAEVGLVGDAGAVLQDLLAELGRGPESLPDTSGWHRGLDEAKAEWRKTSEALLKSGGSPVPTARVVAELQEHLSPDAIVVSDVGNAAKFIAQQYVARHPRTVLSSMSGGAMGFGASGALGAKLAAPNRQVVCWIGDGSMSMSLHVLPTVVELSLPIVYIVLNDYAYGSIRRPQDFRYGKGRNLFVQWTRRDGSLYTLDFAAVARAVGMKAEKVTSADQAGPAIGRALEADEPCLLDVEVEGDTYVPLTGGGTFVLPPRQ